MLKLAYYTGTGHMVISAQMQLTRILFSVHKNTDHHKFNHVCTFESFSSRRQKCTPAQRKAYEEEVIIVALGNDNILLYF